MSTHDEPVISSYAHAPTRTISAGGVKYAYRELGPKRGTPVVFFVHLAATLDNWDPRIVDPIAKDHHVITCRAGHQEVPMDERERSTR